MGTKNNETLTQEEKVNTITSDEKGLIDAVNPLYEYLRSNKNFNPHTKIIVTPYTVEVVQGVMGFTNEQFKEETKENLKQ